MRKPKLKIGFVALAIAFLVPSSAYASSNKPLEAGGWDNLWYGSMVTTPFGAKTPTVYSDGGDFRVCLYNIMPYEQIGVSLYESDPSGATKIGYTHSYITWSGSLGNFCTRWDNIGWAVDGPNKKAEIYAKITSMYNDTVLVRMDN